MTKLRCVVERITFQNAENGYLVMKVKVKGYDDLVTLVGNLLECRQGRCWLCEGEWRVDKRYGQQFQCETWEEVMPATAYGIEKYLGSGLVKGIGPKVRQTYCGAFRNGHHRGDRDRHRAALRGAGHQQEACGEDT